MSHFARQTSVKGSSQTHNNVAAAAAASATVSGVDGGGGGGGAAQHVDGFSWESKGVWPSAESGDELHRSASLGSSE